MEKAKEIFEVLKRIFRKALNSETHLDNTKENALAHNPAIIELMETSVKKLKLESELFALQEETISLAASAIAGGYLGGDWGYEYNLASTLLADVIK